ncbi:MAG: SurA N-terminal domain-containing protein [Alphaproteobacteria bacterium]|nr:SurA N-terminal domain-containing protein [Alphaproteobacteria bacterium]MDX5417461.1 SurA N-terminal domain-containing protein [Alphaproteobacteria bacterium]MDX5494936.1 SurA N-terminal domain-containing protein [Alphaproteobacteria bacterium]
MLDSLRKTASGIVGFAIIGILVIAFAVWGIADIFTGFSDDTVAEVGDQKIDSVTFEREFRMEIDRMSERLGQPLTREQAVRFGGDRMALSRLIAVISLDEAANDLGLAIGDEAVGVDIVNDPNLQGAFGRFDRDLFRQLLRQNGIPEDRFIEQRRKGMQRAQLSGVVEAGIPTPDILTRTILNFQEETRTAGYIILPPSLVTETPAPTEEDIASLYEAGASAFTLPETRDFSVMEIEPTDIIGTIAVSEEQLQEAYAERRGQYDVPERRELVQITFPSEDDASTALARLREGTAVSAIADELGLDEEDLNLGKVTRDELLSPVLADAAFATESGAWSDPVRGPLGWAIFRTDAIEEGKPSTFEDVREQLLASLKIELAREQIYDTQNAIEDARAGGETLASISERFGLQVRNFAGVTANGQTREGEAVDLPDLPGLLDAVFDNMEGDQIPPLDTGKEGYYWIEINTVTPSARKPLDDVRDEIVKVWNDQQRAAALEDIAQKLADRGNAGEDFDKIAGELNRSVLTMPGIQRYAQSDTFSRTAVARMFATPEGSFTWAPVGVGDSLILMQVRSVRTPEAEKESDSYEKARTDVADSIGADMLQTFVVGYQNQAGVKVNQGLVQRLTSADAAQ